MEEARLVASDELARGGRQLLRTHLVTGLTRMVGIVLVSIPVATGSAADGLDVSESVISQLPPDGMIIDSIFIDNRNIYDVVDSGLNGLIFSTANKLHYVTRARVIARELLFAVGDRFSTRIAEETARNLRTRLALNDAWIETEPTSPGHINVKVVTRDQWSLLLGARVHRDGNETDYQFGLEERNLLGNDLFLSFDYFVPENEEDFIRWRLADDRFAGKPLQVNIYYNDNPTDEVRSFRIARPYYDLSQRFSFVAGLADNSGRQDLYRDSVMIAQWYSNADLASLKVNYRSGSYLQKIGIGLVYNYHFETATQKTVFVPVDTTDVVFPDDSIYHEFHLLASVSDQNFIITNRINGFYYPEDIALDRSIRLSYGRVFTSDLKDHHYDLLSAHGSFMQQFGANIVSLSYDRSFWFREGHSIRRTTVVSLLAFNNRLSFLTTAIRGTYFSDWRQNKSTSLNLGGKNGLRGFDTQYTTGDRLFVYNLEGRIYPGIELLSVLFGGVVFLDVGRTWKTGEALKLKHFKRSVGLGLRISMERFIKTELVRIDVAYSQDNNWHFSFGSGQYF